MKTCPRCGKTKPVEEFRVDVTNRHELMPKIYRKKFCKVCEVEVRLEKKHANRYLSAFRQRRQSHARSTGFGVAQLKTMGWDEIQRSREMQAQYENGFCPGCIDDDGTVHFYREMTQGLAELTIDIIDPAAPPVWPGNVQWLCMTCNRRKQRRSGLEDGLERVLVRQWIADEHTDPGPTQLGLFT